jgi:hypothetical protein
VLDGNLAAEYRAYSFSVSYIIIFVRSGKILTFELFCPADDGSCRRIWHVLVLTPVGYCSARFSKEGPIYTKSGDTKNKHEECGGQASTKSLSSL